ncbi:2Fe-2S iron-sulfur cluster-binding protein [Streptomyces yunnanensis]|uniref:Aerobic-type carbon monoxide dehydrogenase, small subunit, CoxS/CutS family n=1 Tax=Streptomyces yunnanensis TaxID=156453 RepID=A0A9X8MK41_9ACTN|nr:(2Fe-2S)-binding protein [Streptomyces yunnanensis]SHK85022.1 Aerobic-type carbon monoxide dehydrogenase, small subunit, CoxS/CutS family [Streptomyces yunnanensis]
MSNADNRHPQQPHPEQGWQPLPAGGEYESEATAFVQLPEGFTTGAYGAGYRAPGADPLAAPGHGYTPPASFPAHSAAPPVPGAGTDPAATGQWTMPFADPSTGYADPAAGYADHMGRQEPAPHHDPAAAYQANAPEGAQPWGGEQVHWPVAGSPEAAGGTWAVPAADDTLEESGEYLVGDDRRPTGHGPAPTYPDGGYSGLPYEGGQAAGQGGPAEAGATGHWNFTAGLNATGGAAGTVDAGPVAGAAGATGVGEGGVAEEPFAAPVEDPYAQGAAAAGTSGATGHWSLPADALAQWPPAGQTAHRQDGAAGRETAAEVPAPSSAEGWSVPVVEGEQPDTTGEFMIDAAHGAGVGALVDPGAASGTPVGEDFTGHGAPAAPEAPAEAQDAHPVPTPPPAADAFAPAAPAAQDAADAGPAVEPVTDVGAPAADPVPAEAAAPAGPAAHEPEDAPAAPAVATHPAPEPVPAAPEAPAVPEAAAVPETLDVPDVPDVAAGLDGHDEHPSASYMLCVNGIDRPVKDAWIGESLLYVLRERLGLAGAKDGCSQGECGACSVQVDGRLVASCLVPAVTAAGSEVRTVEGLARNGVPSDVQQALAASGAVQCGFCVPGMAMTVHDLLEGNHAPTELETRKALCGNLCRCSGYRGVLEAVADVVKSRAEAVDVADEAPVETARIPHQAGPADPMDGTPHHPDAQPGGAG